MWQGDAIPKPKEVYEQKSMAEILEYTDRQGISLYEYVLEHEDGDMEEYLYAILEAMFQSVETGLHKSGVLQGKAAAQARSEIHIPAGPEHQKGSGSGASSDL